MKLFAIKDVKAGLFLRPTTAMSVAEATRNFSLVAKDSESMISRFPNDFRLLHLGEMDMTSGKIQVYSDYVDLGSAADFLPQVPSRDPAQSAFDDVVR